MLVEGTGCVWPYQASDAPLPPFMTPEGKKFSDGMMPLMKAVVRRVIFSPPTETNDVVSEFYEHLISIVSDNPEEGMFFAFDQTTGRVGAKMRDILNEQTNKVEFKPVDGTKRSDLSEEEMTRIKRTLAFHEPTLPLPESYGGDIYKSGKLVPVLKQFNNARNPKNDRTRIFFLLQDIGTPKEQNIIDYLQKQHISSAKVTPVCAGGVGAFQIDLII